MSTLRTDTLSNAAGSKSVPVNTVIDGSAKAWVNFNGTGTVAIRAQFNVTSITDNGPGDYTVNFTTAMPDANYGVTACVMNSDPTYQDSLQIKYGVSPTVSSVRVVNCSTSVPTATFIGRDTTIVNVAIFR